MSFDKIFDLTAGVYFYVYKCESQLFESTYRLAVSIHETQNLGTFREFSEFCSRSDVSALKAPSHKERIQRPEGT